MKAAAALAAARAEINNTGRRRSKARSSKLRIAAKAAESRLSAALHVERYLRRRERRADKLLNALVVVGRKCWQIKGDCKL